MSTGLCRAAAQVALALIEEAPTEQGANEQTEVARAAGASSNQIRRAWRARSVRLNYRLTGEAS